MRIMNRIKFYTRIRHYIGTYGIIDRYRPRNVGVSGVVFQAYGMELCRPRTRDCHSSSSTAERSSYSTSHIALATGVVLMLGSAGKWYLKCFQVWSVAM